jgi:hypothetical protein
MLAFGCGTTGNILHELCTQFDALVRITRHLPLPPSLPTDCPAVAALAQEAAVRSPCTPWPWTPKGGEEIASARDKARQG